MPSSSDPGGRSAIPPPLTRAEAAIALVSAAIGSVLRFVADSPLWLDETLTVNIASGELGDVTELLRNDGHPPLFYLIEARWIDWFGSGDAAVRSLSGVLGLVVMALTAVAADRFSVVGPRRPRSWWSPCRRLPCVTAPRRACTS